jgi:hypothetical protein
MDWMNTKEIVISKKTVYTILLGLVLLVALLWFGGRLSIPSIGQSDEAVSNDLVPGSQEKFAFLSGKGSQRSVGST